MGQVVRETLSQTSTTTGVLSHVGEVWTSEHVSVDAAVCMQSQLQLGVDRMRSSWTGRAC